jgi:AmmeMemoRadiSam system protein B/AmmeMemoRadiSam system protein A
MSVWGCKSQNKNNGDENKLINRMPAVAGKFYESDSTKLLEDLKSLFSKAKLKIINDHVLAVISPHAGYVYSGIVAASSFNQIDTNQKIDNIFLIGSSHTQTFEGASIYSIGHYITPLGKVEVNIELAKKLIKENPVFSGPSSAHIYDHVLEVQLPFLQYKLSKPFKIVPIIIGTNNKNSIRLIAKALEPYFNENNLFVISADFSHYPEYETAYKIDNQTAKAIEKNSTDIFLQSLSDTENKGISDLATPLCSWTSVLTLLYITEKQKDITIKQIEYKNSGDSPYGDKDRVVGYNSIVVSAPLVKIQTKEYTLNENEKKELLNIARNTLTEYLSTGQRPKIDISSLSDNLNKPCGAFVTLHNKGELRGCIGQFEPKEPLYKVVVEMAIAAATQDYRFPKVTFSELKDIDIEISVLTPLKKINSIDEIELGRHGIYIKKGYSSGTFLPQVATSTGWTKEEFLGHCSRDKAGIGWDGWKSADIFTYEAIVFSENEIK